MKKTFVVCHMLASVDGKIDGEFFSAEETAPALKAYGELRNFYNCSAVLYGATTMLGGYADGKISDLGPVRERLPRQDWINPAVKSLGNFIVSVDPKGELAFSSHILEKKGRPAAHVVEALTGQATPEFLAYLRAKGVSYIFAGEKTLDCSLLIHKLQSLLGVQRLMAAGGGVVNWSFLSEGLIDEVSLVIAPVADGSPSAVSSFEHSPFQPSHSPVPLRLAEARVLDESVLWLRYRRSL